MSFYSLAVMFVLALTLPLLALLYFALAEWFNATVAYAVLAMLPLTAFLLVLKFQERMGQLPATLLPLALWLSLLLLVFGIGLTIRAFKRKQGWGYLLLPTLMSSVPLVLVIVMLIQMSRDDYLKHL